MPKPKSVLITVLCTVLNSKKVYIGGLSTRSWDNRYLIVNHTEDPDEAREFLNPGHAESIMIRLVNHHNRTYTVEQVTINVSRRHALLEEDTVN